MKPRSTERRGMWTTVIIVFPIISKAHLPRKEDVEMIFFREKNSFLFKTIQHTFSINKEQYSSSFKTDSCDKQIKVMERSMRPIKRGEKKTVV